VQRLLVLFLGLFGLFSSCKPDFFCDPTTSLSSIQIALYTYKCPKTLGTTVETDSAYSQRFYKVYALNALVKDSALYSETLPTDTIGFRNLVLPISNLADSVVYVFQINTSTGLTPILVNDTLKVNYSKILHYISAGCGYNYYYTINKASFTNHYFNFFSQVSASVSPTIPINFKFYNTALLKKCPAVK